MSYSKLIIIEGIPGSGKTTTAKFVEERLASKKMNVCLFNEGNPNHPADFEQTAFFEHKDYNEMVIKCKNIGIDIQPYSNEQGRGSLVQYGKLMAEMNGNIPDDILQHLYKNDVYELPLELHTEFILDRWKSFVEEAKNRDNVYIFECCFIQNPITVLLGKHNAPKEQILAFLHKLAQIIKPLYPHIIYIHQEDIRKTVENVMKQRSKEWFEHVCFYYTQQEYGKSKDLSNDLDGVVQFLTNRKLIEFEFLKDLFLHNMILDNSNNEWEVMLEKVQNYLQEIQ